MKLEIIAIGTEIVLGQLIDTNSKWIASECAQHGIKCHYIVAVDDHIERIVQALKIALSRADIIICCGGLGPTQDDLTRHALAKCLNQSLVFDEKIAEQIRIKFQARQRLMSDNNLQQAYYPSAAQILSCFPGTAPGLKIVDNEQVIFAVPGVPRELKAMFNHDILPYLKQRQPSSQTCYTQTIKAWGLSESEIAHRLNPLNDTLTQLGNPSLSFLASGINGIKIRLTMHAPSEETAITLLQPYLQQIQNCLGHHIYAYHEQETLESLLISQLEKQQHTIALYEQFTAGLISTRLSASYPTTAVIKGGIMATPALFCSQNMPHQDTLSEHTLAQAYFIQTHYQADYGIAVCGTEILQDDTHYYLVWLAIATKNNHTLKSVMFLHDYEQAREFTAIELFMTLRTEMMKEKSEAAAIP